jgi:hypothetical protein
VLPQVARPPPDHACARRVRSPPARVRRAPHRGDGHGHNGSVERVLSDPWGRIPPGHQGGSIWMIFGSSAAPAPAPTRQWSGDRLLPRPLRTADLAPLPPSPAARAAPSPRRLAVRRAAHRRRPGRGPPAGPGHRAAEPARRPLDHRLGGRERAAAPAGVAAARHRDGHRPVAHRRPGPAGRPRLPRHGGAARGRLRPGRRLGRRRRPDARAQRPRRRRAPRRGRLDRRALVGHRPRRPGDRPRCLRHEGRPGLPAARGEGAARRRRPAVRPGAAAGRRRRGGRRARHLRDPAPRPPR